MPRINHRRQVRILYARQRIALLQFLEAQLVPRLLSRHLQVVILHDVTIKLAVMLFQHLPIEKVLDVQVLLPVLVEGAQVLLPQLTVELGLCFAHAVYRGCQVTAEFYGVGTVAVVGTGVILAASIWLLIIIERCAIILPVDRILLSTVNSSFDASVETAVVFWGNNRRRAR